MFHNLDTFLSKYISRSTVLDISLFKAKWKVERVRLSAASKMALTD